jgi:hypothetical protein
MRIHSNQSVSRKRAISHKEWNKQHKELITIDRHSLIDVVIGLVILGGLSMIVFYNLYLIGWMA